MKTKKKQRASLPKAEGLRREIRKKKLTEEQLNAAHSRIERLLRFNEALLSAVPTPIFYKDKQGRYLGCNRAFSEIMGVTTDQIQGKTVMEIWPSEFAEVYHKKDLDLMNDPKQQVYEFKVRDKDGRGRPVIYAKDVYRDENGQVAGIVGAFLDITEQKQAEYRIKQAKDEWERTFDAIVDPVMIVDSKHIIRKANKSMAAALGLTPREIEGLACYEAVHNATEPPVSCPHAQLLADNCPHSTEVYEERLGGHFIVSVSPLLGPDGTLSGSVHLARNITEHKKIEAELRESEQRFKTVFDNNNDGLLVSDIKNKKFLFGNLIICKMLGYEEDELKGLAVSNIHPQEALPAVIKQYERQAKKEITVAENVPVKRKDGTIFYADINSAPITLSGRNYLMGAFRDVTERKQAEEAVRKLNAELEQKVRERTEELLDAQGELVRKEKLAILGQLAGSVGHELRNPLGVISNAIYYLKSVLPQTDATVKEYLNIIKSEVDISGRIISDLLDFSRTKTPQAHLVSLAEIVRRSMDACAVPETIQVRTDLPEDLPAVRVDSVQMGQVFQNLIVNAVQAMQKGGSLSISARLISDPKKEPEQSAFPAFGGAGREANPHSAIEISVTDTGEGISPENLKKLFHPLFTTKVRGIGLGLVVTKRNVEANNGRLSVESREGEGSTFRVLLPIEEAAV